MRLGDLIARIEQLYDATSIEGDELRERARAVFEEFICLLDQGKVRAAEPEGDRWVVHSWVKKGILLGFRIGQMRDYSLRPHWRFFDKDTYPLKEIDGLADSVRIVPGGSSVRRGVYLGPQVVIMPPSYINVGAYVGEGTMVDSHVLVGSCAQIGRRVHLSAGTQIGGVLEPAGALPVIVEDDVFIGGQCGLFEGVLIKRRAVLSAGVILTGSTPVYDLVRETVYRRNETDPLIIPEGAVVIPGARPAEGYFARSHQLMMAAPLIVKYRDDRTDARTALEMSLR
jgi:2,3,4,5-tetrahydropyridine-2-carboxylate N-succinyltransferase